MALAAELHRKRAALLLCARACDVGAAEADLRRALESARQQKARSLELRAARDLALVMAERGERQQAADLLSPVYGRFTEGFDKLDLKESKVLFDQLRP
jgi:predicted ATPase